MPQECALIQVGLTGQLLALQELQEQLKREGWRALQPEVQAEQEISKLQEQLAAAQVTDEAAQQGVKRLEQEVKRLEQQLAGSQTATAPKEQELVATLVQSDDVCTCLSCTNLYALS